MFKLRFGVALAICGLLSIGTSDSYGAAAKGGKGSTATAEKKAGDQEDAKKAAAPVQTESLFKYLEYAGTLGYVIVGVSFLGVGLILKQIFFLRRGTLCPKKVQVQLDELFKQKKIKEAMAFCQKNQSVLARIVASGLTEIRAGYDSMVDVMRDVGEEESIRVNQSVGYLSLVGAIAPMLGLLGTVLGMIEAFQSIASSEGMAKPAELASNIQKALTTTCMGLMVAVPAIVAYTVFRNRAVRLMLEVGVAATELTSRFKGMRIAPAAAQAAAPAPTPAPAPKPAPAEGVVGSSGEDESSEEKSE